MTGGAGFSQDATNRTKQNRNLRTHIKDTHYKSDGHTTKHAGALKYNETDTETIEKFKQEAKQRNKSERIKNGVVYGVILLVVVIIVLWYLN